MLFQQPVVFPESIEANMIFGLRHHRHLRRKKKTDDRLLLRCLFSSEACQKVFENLEDS